MMKTLKFKCTLLSDVVVNQKAATEGNNNTLDFIPGNAFLGIAATHYKDLSSEKAWEIFHSGKVRFGDAHPMKSDNIRSLRVPASLFYPKMKSEQEVCYIHHFYQRKNDKGNDGKPQQLKQCRNGFYEFTGHKAAQVPVEKTFAIKSAYDRDKRRSKDEQMYGYESLDAGLQLLFKVEVDNDALAGDIEEWLIGIKQVGRSRTAQYGEVKIEKWEFEEVSSKSNTFSLEDSEQEYVTVYADGRLMFLDENGELTLQPSAYDLGIEGGEIDWEKSQVRTFQYAPWNNKRATRDADRLGIEKGSVFVVKVSKGAQQNNLKSQSVGVYRNEGFGMVIYNPEFLDADLKTNGKAIVSIKGNDEETSMEKQKPKTIEGNTPLLKYIRRKQKRNEAQMFIYRLVNEFVEMHRGLFIVTKSERFASQWGTIRSIAMQKRKADDIEKALFDDKATKDKGKGYLVHGVASEQWKNQGRLNKLKSFIDEVKSKKVMEKYGDILCEALVNLSSEMAKISKKQERHE